MGTLILLGLGLWFLSRNSQAVSNLLPGNNPDVPIGTSQIVIPDTQVETPAPVVSAVPPMLQEPVITENQIINSPDILGNLLPGTPVSVSELYGANAASTIPAYNAAGVESGNAGYDAAALRSYVLTGVYDSSVLDHYYQWGSYWMKKRLTPGTRYFSPGSYAYYHENLPLALQWLHDRLYSDRVPTWEFYYQQHVQ